ASIKRLTEEEFARTSTKGFRGQTIVFTYSRARCQLIADALGPGYSAYHAGLTSQERREVESKFAAGKIKAVITTAALGAGVDFPASQVIFDSLAMGIKWLSVGEFNQMAGRAGRPDFHDSGRVVILAEPGCTYSRESKVTEEEMALLLLKGEMEEVAPHHSLEASGEEFVANAVVCRGDEHDLDGIQGLMVGSMEPVLPRLIEENLVRRTGGWIELTDMARVMARHFIGPVRLLEIRRLVREIDNPIEILAELEGIEEADDESRGKERKQTRKRK
ncbi:MAG: DEAD/DEAH box helicase, partial [Methanoregulaceae archaeon]|nr:DEAD/DEAH box helicase [Methanoregulaceae archaeon]